MSPYRPGRRSLAAAALAAVVVSAALVALERSRGASAPVTAEAQIASFRTAPGSASLPTDAERKRFVSAFSHGPGLVKTLDLTRARRFSLGPAGGFSLVAAPDAKGGLCYLDSASGGVCIDTFEKGAGMTMGYRKVGGVKHNVITGLLPDRVVKIAFRSAGGSAATQVHDNVFQFVVPQVLWDGIESYTLTYADGSTRTEPISV